MRFFCVKQSSHPVTIFNFNCIEYFCFFLAFEVSNQKCDTYLYKPKSCKYEHFVLLHIKHKLTSLPITRSSNCVSLKYIFVILGLKNKESFVHRKYLILNKDVNRCCPSPYISMYLYSFCSLKSLLFVTGFCKHCKK